MTLLLDKYTKKDDEEGDFVDIALENLREYGDRLRNLQSWDAILFISRGL